MGVQCVIYIDDILLMHQIKQNLRGQMALALGLLEALGFLVKYPKSQLEPSQVIDYLGFVIDSIKKELRLPKEKLNQIRVDVTQMLKQSKGACSIDWEDASSYSCHNIYIYYIQIHCTTEACRCSSTRR